jgi:parallel beta-helix repeat protein
MNKGFRMAGLVLVLGLFLSVGNWQQQSQAAGQIGSELKQLFSLAAAPTALVAAPIQDPAAVTSTITVTSLGDGAANAANCPGPNCRLRDAIAKAVDGDTIDFSVTGTITLSSNQLEILGNSRHLTINGPGPAQLTISGNGASRVFFVGATVALSGMTIANGLATPQFGGTAGGIYNYGNLTLTNCTVSGNQTIALYNYIGGTLTITDSMLSGNSGDFGGALYNSGTAILTNCTLNGNSAAYGAGLYDLGIATLTTCTLSGNSVTHRGGGITMDYGGNMTLTNCTISGNSAGLEGGGICNNDTSINGDLKVKNTLIAGNSAANSSPDMKGKLTSQGYNLIGNNSGATITPATGDLIGTIASPINPLLAPLANYGGPTQTRALLPSSPAIDAGAAATNPATGQALITDQRGGLRPRDLSASNAGGGNASDIGAFELQNDPTLAINPATLPGGAVGSTYNQTLSATGGSGNYSFSLSSGFLPPGLTLAATGQISGTPTVGSNFSFTVVVRDISLSDVYGTRTYTITMSSVCAPVPSGLVDWWRAEGNANDAIGSNHGTLNGSASFSTTAAGFNGQAFKFDGTNGYVALPDNLFSFPTSGTSTTPFSFELWFKSAASGGVILGQQDVAPYNTAAGNAPAIYVGTDGKLRVEMFWNGAANPLTSASTVNDNLIFHHLAITYNGTQQIAYLDGQVMGNQTHTQTAYNSAGYKYQLGTGGTDGWPAGSSANGGWFNFTGLIDEPSLYNRALTLPEVQALYGAGNAGKCFNSAPSFTPAAAISRQQGSPAGAAMTVGTVSDGQTAAGSLTVTQIAGGSATGIIVTGITNTGGTITAMVSASCTATAGTVRFQVSDGSLTGTGNLQVNVTNNSAPTLVYANTTVSLSGSTTNSPTTATDNGAITAYVVQSQGTYTGTISVNASGVVSFSNAAPVGNHTITIRATDNCGATTNAQFTLTVSACAATLSKTTQNFAANGGTGTFTLTINPACQWTAVSNDPGFITIVSPTGQQTGTGTVTFSVASHTSAAPRNGTITVAGQTFTVRQGMLFPDVPVGANFYEEIGKLSAVGITLGCGQGNYCPDSSVTRQQMAAFLSRALGVFNPPTPGAQRFADVLPDNPFYAFIEELAVRQITLGCGGGNYCPDSSVTREQMAAFIIRALHEPGYVPPLPGMQRFADVPPDNPFYRYIEEMAVRQITLGCGGSNYCPTANVTRGQMAAFLVRAFGL